MRIPNSVSKERTRRFVTSRYALRNNAKNIIRSRDPFKSEHAHLQNVSYNTRAMIEILESIPTPFLLLIVVGGTALVTALLTYFIRTHVSEQVHIGNNEVAGF